mmetsp:Transcript_11600/g.34150  ORF Transcript_11600/g.34150 Transcript_11600/m.34150 type:complete len:81 (-) Transcript_11600:530-772(-)
MPRWPRFQNQLLTGRSLHEGDTLPLLCQCQEKTRPNHLGGDDPLSAIILLVVARRLTTTPLPIHSGRAINSGDDVSFLLD